MDGTNDRAHDSKARLKTTTWAALKRLYLKSERPRARRYSFVASIELTDVQSETHFTEQTSNLSLFGCRVDSEKLLPAGIRVRVRIMHTGASFVALGKVVYSVSSAGIGVIGVVFIEIEPSHQFILEKWIAQLRDRERRARERAARFLFSRRACQCRSPKRGTSPPQSAASSDASGACD